MIFVDDKSSIEHALNISRDGTIPIQWYLIPLYKQLLHVSWFLLKLCAVEDAEVCNRYALSTQQTHMATHTVETNL